MLDSVAGSVLLVGEGDFSFSVALCRKLQSRMLQVTSTSYESEATIKKHAQAQENTTCLKQLGVSVLLSVDATALHNDNRFMKSTWDYIIFMFPHVGGKSNIKKNRQLLKDFFISASQVVHTSSMIAVTLCQGQGGVPLDQPMRAWHDSWQVVAMATFGGLILAKISPFSAEDYREYSSSGFRSQDKGFHTAGALTYAFVKSTSLHPSPVGNDCPAELLTKNQSDASAKVPGNSLNMNCFYPVSFGSCAENTQLASSKNAATVRQPLNMHKCDQNEKIPVLKCNEYITRQLHAELHLIENHPIHIVEKLIMQSMQLLWDCENLNSTKLSADTTHERDCLLYHKYMENENKIFVLHEFLLGCVENVLNSKPVKAVLLSGYRHKQCLISEIELPVSYQLMAVKPMNGQNFEDLTSAVVNLLNSNFKKCDVIQNRSTSVPERLLCRSESIEYQVEEVCELQSQNESGLITLGQVMIVEKENLKYFIVVITIDRVALEVFKIRNYRQLWCKDARFLDQFCDSSCDNQYSDYSLYSPTYTHDISFWIDKNFKEQLFHNMIRDIAGDYVVSVTLIDKYCQDDPARESRCYRLIFQAVQAMSYMDSYSFYQLIRNSVPECLGVTLR